MAIAGFSTSVPPISWSRRPVASADWLSLRTHVALAPVRDSRASLVVRLEPAARPGVVEGALLAGPGHWLASAHTSGLAPGAITNRWLRPATVELVILSRTEQGSAETPPSLSSHDGDIALEQEWHEPSRALYVSRVGRAEAREIFPFLGDCGSNQKAACDQRQRDAADCEWVLQIRAPHQRQQRRVQGVPDEAIRAYRDQRGWCSQKGDWRSGRLWAPACQSREAAGILQSPVLLRWLRGTMRPVGEPRAGRETTWGRSAGSAAARSSNAKKR